MEKLRPGDILTHTHFSSNSREVLVDENGNVKAFAYAAQKRAIIFDVGHGGGGFQYVQAIPALEQGIWLLFKKILSSITKRKGKNWRKEYN